MVGNANDERARVEQRFKDVFGDSRPEYLAMLLDQLPIRGLGQVMGDIGDAELEAKRARRLPGPSPERIDV